MNFRNSTIQVLSIKHLVYGLFFWIISTTTQAKVQVYDSLLMRSSALRLALIELFFGLARLLTSPYPTTGSSRWRDSRLSYALDRTPITHLECLDFT